MPSLLWAKQEMVPGVVANTQKIDFKPHHGKRSDETRRVFQRDVPAILENAQPNRQARDIGSDRRSRSGQEHASAAHWELGAALTTMCFRLLSKTVAKRRVLLFVTTCQHAFQEGRGGSEQRTRHHCRAGRGAGAETGIALRPEA